MGIITDVDQYSLYGEEGAATYGTVAAAIAFKWGLIQEIKTADANNMRYHYGIGAGRTPQQVTAGLFDASVSVVFELQTAEFMKWVLGSVSGTGVSGDPYEYVVADALRSTSIEVGQDMTTDEIYNYLGCLVDRCHISCSLGEPVLVTVDNFAKTKTRATSGIQAYTALTDSVYTFVRGTFETPAGTTIAEIEKCDVEILNKVIKNAEIGSRLQICKVTGREIRIVASGRLIDGTFAQLQQGGSAGPATDTPADNATAQLQFTDGTKYIYVNFTDVYLDTRDTSGRIHENVMEDGAFLCLGVSVSEVVEL